MRSSTTEQEQLYLSAALRALDARSTQSTTAPGRSLFEAQLQRFPPIEDVVTALDRIASRTIAA
jgi:hypothetical protein